MLAWRVLDAILVRMPCNAVALRGCHHYMHHYMAIVSAIIGAIGDCRLNSSAIITETCAYAHSPNATFTNMYHLGCMP